MGIRPRGWSDICCAAATAATAATAWSCHDPAESSRASAGRARRTATKHGAAAAATTAHSSRGASLDDSGAGAAGICRRHGSDRSSGVHICRCVEGYGSSSPSCSSGCCPCGCCPGTARCIGERGVWLDEGGARGILFRRRGR